MSGREIPKKIIKSFLAASIGAVGGFLYARYQLPAKLLEDNSAMPGIFATAGAAVGMLVLRMGKIFWVMFSDYALKQDE